jgi:flagellar protein FliL
MSEPAPKAEETAPAKKGGKKMLIIIFVVLLLAGGGVGGFFYYTRVKAAEHEETGKEKGKKDKKDKKGKKESEEEEGAEHKGEHKDKEKGEKGEKGEAEETSVEVELPDDAEVKEVIELQPFIVNLADQDEARYLRLSVSVGLGESEGHEKPSALFTTRVRNAMLSVLATKRSDELRTPKGKSKLRKELLEAAQASSEEPHVQAIYITDFIIQL